MATAKIRNKILWILSVLSLTKLIAHDATKLKNF